MSFAKARDQNEPEIVNALRAVGATVIRLDTPVDLLVGYRGANFLIEVKRQIGPRGGTRGSVQTPCQDEFFRSWQGKAAVARNPHEALRHIGAIK